MLPAGNIVGEEVKISIAYFFAYRVFVYCVCGYMYVCMYVCMCKRLGGINLCGSHLVMFYTR